MGLQINSAYLSPTDLIDELAFAGEIFRKGQFATVDTTDKPIEESAHEIVAPVKRELSFSGT